ncbi:thiopeptide-type bacteriocin biosynthesis protein [Streptomyces griseorubiginosus]|uniref:thiopeptide-type bacteriocin biosynthesis protein n=1 Tax=Streptomyces griseorubiginosus TaxID=67304 RepID=UPI0036E55C26
MGVTPVPRRLATWSSVNCYLYWAPAQTDTFITATLAPLMEAFRDSGRIERWFFNRHAENGPHLRVTALGNDPAIKKELREQLTHAVREAPYTVDDWGGQTYRRTAGGAGTPRGHGEVSEALYEPETERYGGAAALLVAEEVFCRSSRIAAAVVEHTTGSAQRLAAATDFVLATAIALDLDLLDTVVWLRRGVISRRATSCSTNPAPMTALGLALDPSADQSAAVARRWHDIQASRAAGTRLRDQWAACVREARARLETGEEVSRARWLQVWSLQLHALLNRMGVLPEEERSLCWFIATSLRALEGVTDYFADHPGAADRRYLDVSSFTPSRILWQQPRKAPGAAKPPQHSPFTESPLALKAEELQSMPLGEALTRRASGRGDLGGRTTSESLGTLLWSARIGHAEPDAHGHIRRPYPSAGGQYATQLRLIVRDVAGLNPGIYELSPQTRTLLPIGPAPATEEIIAASMWFQPAIGPDRYIDVSTLPALIGLYVELGALRAVYGLRALRFAFLEAGHLAQNLALIAAATELSLGMLGAFYDDIAHELFMLDGIDDVLAYLLPVGRLRFR